MTDARAYEELLREGIEAFNRGEVEAVLPMFAEDVECYIPADLANSGTWRGHDGFLEMVRGWNEAFSELRNEIVSLEFPDDRHVIAEIHQEGVGAGSGVPVEMPVFYMLELRELKAVRFHLYADRESALAAARHAS